MINIKLVWILFQKKELSEVLNNIQIGFNPWASSKLGHQIHP